MKRKASPEPEQLTQEEVEFLWENSAADADLFSDVIHSRTDYFLVYEYKVIAPGKILRRRNAPSPDSSTTWPVYVNAMDVETSAYFCDDCTCARQMMKRKMRIYPRDHLCFPPEWLSTTCAETEEKRLIEAIKKKKIFFSEIVDAIFKDKVFCSECRLLMDIKDTTLELQIVNHQRKVKRSNNEASKESILVDLYHFFPLSRWCPLHDRFENDEEEEEESD